MLRLSDNGNYSLICKLCYEMEINICYRYEAHYGLPLGKKRGAAAKAEAAETALVTKSKSVERKLAARAPTAKVESALETQFAAGRLYAAISSRPGQSGRVDGYILEGEELAFYQKQLRK